MKTPWLGEKVRLGMLNQTAGQGLIDDSEGCGKIVPQWYHAYPVRCLMLCNLVKQIVVRKTTLHLKHPNAVKVLNVGHYI